ncbi:ceramidase domain-containing protein [Stappia indica]|uniref:ceramidase domain-containing protein n=1 Tax=Stappia indica TaxID=538381 RepID=UPI001CD6C597|nr:ceramidase domain-containing protein [Stappia indica]MCA1297813.1 ceramidase domain-containing protein [Stappia indica]
MMDWTAAVDGYCERVAPGFWQEPVNAVTNLAFLLAATLALRSWRRSGGDDRAGLALILIVFSVGIGSFLFHTFANRWSGLADVLPIMLFIQFAFYLALRRVMGLSVAAALLLTLAFLVVSSAVGPWLARSVGSSGAYLPAGLAIVGIAALAPRDQKAQRRALFVTGLLFFVSLGFRAGDMPVCPAFPIGTHFVWHCLNAVVLYRLIRVLSDARGGVRDAVA